MKKHYRDAARSNKEWYIIEDKISYSLEFIKWFIKDLNKKYIKRESDSESSVGKEESKNFFIQSK